MSYTTFSYSQLSVASDSHTFGARDTLQFSFSVTNTGSRKGRAIPQVSREALKQRCSG